MDQPESKPAAAKSRWWGGVVLVCAVPLILAIGFSVGRNVFSNVRGSAEEKVEPATELPKDLFKNWGTPEVALLLSGQTFGYLQPCGCSSPQYGGLVRRYNLVKLLEKKGWKDRIAGIDLGEIYPPKSDMPEQSREKFKTALRAMSFMNYQDFGLGLPELKMPLVNGLAEMLALNIKNPRPLSLDLKDPNRVFEALAVRSYDVIDGKAKVGVSSMVGPSVAKAMAGAQGIDFFDNAPMVRSLLNSLAKEKVDVTVLLVHGTAKEAEDIAKMCFDERAKNDKLPNVNLIIHTSEFDTPPARPAIVDGTNTHLLFMGHKAKDVGVLGLFRKPAGGYELKYELVSLGPNFETPKDQEAGHPVMKLMQDYAESIKNLDLLEKYKALRVQHPTQRDEGLAKAGISAKYVGSERCGDCHAGPYKVWKDSKHAKGYDTLEQVKNPSLRQFDPECVMCHTVGFKYRTGYFDPPAGANANQIKKHNAKLLQVGCESCHGPGSMHANDPKNAAYHPLINPIKGIDDPTNPNAKILADRFCQTCHDIENDVHWGAKKPFHKSWAQIVHPDPNRKNAGNVPAPDPDK